jgi:hypothetical protein
MMSSVVARRILKTRAVHLQFDQEGITCFMLGSLRIRCPRIPSAWTGVVNTSLSGP